ncbi:MAG: hypothetical protein PHN84_15390 [Desulfuromonadaceae bacterium]|nr:hypothetical protein [Desulfuromonadaceae bacterium]
MTTAAIERENRSGREPERLDTAIERGEIVPFPTEKNNLQCHCSSPCPVCFCREDGKP